MEALRSIMAKHLNMSGMSFNEMTPREYEQWKVDGLNDCEGNEHERDGFHCAICKNKGYIVKLQELPNERFSHVISDCKCSEIRRSIMRMKKSGLKNIISDYTFEKYEALEPWQQTIKDAAMNYVKTPEGWFFLGGQSGAGKTHISTAICREFLLKGRQVVYMLWRDDIEQIKSLSREDPEKRIEMLNRFKTADILYIDDLFKTGKSPDGSYQRPTSADVNAAFEIINYRYNNPDLLTIVSSEWTEADLLDIDEATGGRIIEKAKTFSIAKDRSRNYRTRKAVTV